MAGYDVVWDGVPVCEKFGLVLTGFSETPPEPRTSSIKVPGRHGEVDTSETVAGEMLYDSRKLKFTFACEADGDQAAMSAITRLRGAMHGQRREFSLSWDEGYTYAGRAEVVEADISRGGYSVTVTIDADPWKVRPGAAYRLDGTLGRTYEVESGARPVTPTVEAEQRTVIDYYGETFEFGPDKSVDDRFKLHDGANVITIDTTPGYGTSIWSDYASSTWDAYEGQRMYWLANNHGDALVSKTWEELGASETWSSYGLDAWKQQIFKSAGDSLAKAYATLLVDWSDL